MPAELAARIDQALAVPELRALIGAYSDENPTIPFAGALFDELGENPPERFCESDLLAASRDTYAMTARDSWLDREPVHVEQRRCTRLP